MNSTATSAQSAKHTYKLLVGVSGFPSRLIASAGDGVIVDNLVTPPGHVRKWSRIARPSIVGTEGLVVHAYSTEPIIVGGVLRNPRKIAYTVPSGAALYLDPVMRPTGAEHGSATVPTGAYWLTIESSLPIIEE